MKCRKTKTKAFTLENHKVTNTVNQSKVEANTRDWRKGRENVCERVTIGSAFTSDWMKKGRDFFFKPIT